MKKALLFSLACAAAGPLVVFGCSSSDSTPAATSPEDSGAPDTKPKPAPTSTGPTNEEDAGACPLPDAGGTSPKFIPPKPHQEACSTDEMVKINALLAKYGTSVTFATFQNDVTNDTTISGLCRGCIFTNRDDATWGPIPLNAQANGSVNYEGCYAQLSGSDDCGKDYLAYDTCLHDACDTCAAAGAERTSCYQTAFGDVCKASSSAWTAACGSIPAAKKDACGKIGGVIVTMCAVTGDAGVTDAGGDASDSGN